MTQERQRRVEQLYQAALELASERRGSFLAAACGDDTELRDQVLSLLTPPDETRTMLTAGFRLGPYQIVSPIGEGGMGKVYRALDTRLGRAVAIKISAGQFSQRFEREAQAISALNHPHICTLYDVGSLPTGACYLVTELVEGETLRSWLRQSPAMERRIEVARQVLEAMHAAHSAGIIHRDLKPANIMVRFDGYVKVLDFGLAKRISAAGPDKTADTETVGVSAPGQIVGTAAYMSPEQILGHDVDARSDLFAFGIILYEMISGRHPWPHKSSVDAMHAILHQAPPADLPANALGRVVRRCLEKKPGLRFQTAAELQAALEQAAVESAPKPEERQPSIAVMPFTNMSADRENDYFGDGLAEEIINVLAHQPGMKVAGRTSSSFFRGKDVEFKEIGARLNVDYVLDGSVRKAGNRIRVTAQLIKAADGFHLWSERYDRQMTDIFAIQDEVTQAITDALRVKLSPQPAARPRHEPNLRAYEAYLTARALWFKGTKESQARFKEAIDRAIALDPEFAPSHVLLGGHYSMLAHTGVRPPHESIPLARAAEEEALRLDPSLAEPHALLAVWAGTFSFDWNDAERRWQRALALDPVSRDIRFWYGNHYLLPIGRAAEAVEAMAWGLEGDPLNLMYRCLWARGLQHCGRLREAEAELRKILALDENFPGALSTLALVCARQGRFAEALGFAERAHALMPWSNVTAGQLAALLVRTGDRSRADVLVENLRSANTYLAPSGLAIFYAICGEVDRAAEWAERSIDERYLEFRKVLGPWLEHTPAWPALALRMNLPGAIDPEK